MLTWTENLFSISEVKQQPHIQLKWLCGNQEGGGGNSLQNTEIFLERLDAFGKL